MLTKKINFDSQVKNAEKENKKYLKSFFRQKGVGRTTQLVRIEIERYKELKEISKSMKTTLSKFFDEVIDNYLSKK
jgi:hypothetical protein